MPGLVMAGHTGWEHPLQVVPAYGDWATFMGQAGATYSPQITLGDYPKGVALEYWLGERDLWRDPLQLAWSPWQEIAARRQRWPLDRPYGPHAWTNDDIRRSDIRADDYWDRRPPR